MDMNINFLAVFLLPCLAGIFKKEIAATWDAWCIYHHRPFDVDRNPETPDLCLMFNPATGKWGLVIIHRYVFWRLRSSRRGVWFSHVTSTGRLRSRQVGLNEWGRLPKAELEYPMDSNTRKLLRKHNLYPVPKFYGSPVPE